MGYDLPTGTKAPIIDADGNPLTHDQITGSITDETIVTFTEVDTVVYLLAGVQGSTDVAITPTGGDAVTHTVTVTGTPFDWSLGTPVAA